MKLTRVQYLLPALLLAAMAVPSIGDHANTANRRNSGKIVTAPSVVADAFPTPWPKKPGGVGEAPAAPVTIADAFPTPWPRGPVVVSTPGVWPRSG